MKRYSRIKARRTVSLPSTTSGGVFVGHDDLGRVLLPLRVQRQQALADRLVKRPGVRLVMKDVNPATGVALPDALRFRSGSVRRAA